VDASRIIERACTRAIDAAGILLGGLYLGNRLDVDAVFPPIAEVVDVRELAPLLEAEILQAEPSRVLGGILGVHVLGIVFGEAPVRNLELIEVRVGPPKGVLKAVAEV
jgi:hypothetical protein